MIGVPRDQENSKYPIAYYWAHVDKEFGDSQREHDTPGDVFSDDRQWWYGMYVKRALGALKIGTQTFALT